VVLLIVLASVVVLAMVNAVLSDAQVQGQVVGIVLLAGLGWWAWHQLPGAVRSGMRKAVKWAAKGRTRHDRH
jgi:ABC-type nickel/cobalt efflux system permease component RcnA